MNILKAALFLFVFNFAIAADSLETKAGVVNTPGNELSDYVLVTYKAPRECERVFVFTDPTCPYCKKLHKHIGDLNGRGISVSYIPISRKGPYSRTGRSIKKLYCEKNKGQAVDDIFDRMYFGDNECEFDNYGAYELANALRIKGTPAIIRDDGRVFYGGKNIYCGDRDDKRIEDQKG